MKPRSNPFLVALLMVVAHSGDRLSAASLYWKTSTAASWDGSSWSSAAGGPYTQAWVSGSDVVFEDNLGVALTIKGPTTTTNFNSILANENVTVTASSTLGTGGTVAVVDVAAGKVLDFAGQSISTAAGTGFIKNGAGTWSLSGGTYAGGFTLNAGTLAVGGVNAMGSGGALTLNAGTVRSSGTAARDLSGKYPSGITLGGNVTLGDATSNGALTITNALTLKRGSGGSNRALLSLGASSTWSGNITLDGTTASGFAGVMTGGTTAATACVISGNIGYSTLGTATSALPTFVLRSSNSFGRISGSVSLSTGYVQLLDSSKWEFSNSSNTWATLDISNASAIASVGATNTLPAGGIVTSTVGGTLQLNNQAATTAYSQKIAGLGGNVKVALSTGAATLTLDTASDQSNSGVISGAISLVKSGTAKQTLTGANTYTGSTTINGGTLALGSTGAISSGDLSISSATLDLRKGTSTRVPNVANLSLNNAVLDVGLNASPDGLNVTGAASISGSNTIKLHGTIAAGTYNLISTPSPLTGTFVLDTSGVTVSGFTGSYTADIDGNNYVLTVGGTPTPYVAYWNGDVSSVWNDSSVAPGSNWATDSSGTEDTAQIPGAITDVYFSTAGAINTTTTLGADLSINSLTFETGTTTVGGANTLSILTTGGNALDVLSGASATLSTATTAISGTASVREGGTLTVNSGGLGSGTLVVDGILNLNSNTANAVLNGGSTGVISRGVAGTSTLGVSGSANSNYAGSINDGSGVVAVSKGGSSTLTLSGGSTYSGGTVVSGGIIKANSSSALGTGTVAINGGQRLSLGEGVTVANAITIGTNTSPQGAGILEGSSTVITSATLSGPINITSGPAGGGHFINNGTGSFDVKGTITSTVAVIHRNGTVTYWGGGTGYNAMSVTGTARLGANNGLSTTAVLNVGVSGAGTFDLAGYNQSLPSIVKDANAATVGNSSTTADSLLTITGTSTFNGVIRDALGSGTRKTGLAVSGGTLTLGGLNTYTGNTTVNSGTLILADNAQLRFAIGATSGTTNSLTGASATLNGDFNIDTSLADASALTSGSWTLENVASLTGAYGTTFQVLSGTTAWTATGDTWSKTVGAKTYTFDETTGVLSLTSGGYDSWASSKGLSGADADFDADPDHDGLDNGLEFVFGGEPNPASPGSNSASLLPTVAETAGDLIFTFKRKDLSESGVTLLFQWSTDLSFPSPANDVPVGASDSTSDGIVVDVTEDSPDADTDTIVVTVPAARAAGGKLFGRLMASKLP